MVTIILSLVTAASYGAGDFFGGLAAKRTSLLTVLAGSHVIGAAGAVTAAVVLGSPAGGRDLLLGVAGGFIGWVAGHLLIGGLASPFIEDRTGVSIGVFDFSPKINLFSWLGNSPIMNWGVSGELLLVPGLVLLAIIVGLMPALAAYRTDVAESL